MQNTFGVLVCDDVWDFPQQQINGWPTSRF
jgi:hypothetical protein